MFSWVEPTIFVGIIQVVEANLFTSYSYRLYMAQEKSIFLIPLFTLHSRFFQDLFDIVREACEVLSRFLYNSNLKSSRIRGLVCRTFITRKLLSILYFCDYKPPAHIRRLRTLFRKIEYYCIGSSKLHKKYSYRM